MPKIEDTNTKVIWTEEQLEAINSRGRNVLVSAAAGSGKTAVLVERIRTLVADEQAPIGEFLVVTFTNAAAAEMKDKLRKALNQELARETDEKKTKYLRKQLVDLETAYISTFHAFGLAVIRRFFYKIDLEPGFKVADETETGILKEQAMDDLLDSRFKEFSDDFVAFMDAYSGDRSSNSVRKLIFDAHTRLRTLPNSWEWMEEQIRGENLEPDNFVNSTAWSCILDDIYSNIAVAIDNYSAAADLIESVGFGDQAQKIRENEIEACKEALEITAGAPGFSRGMGVGNGDLDGFQSRTVPILNELAEVLAYKTSQVRIPKEDKEIYETVKDRVSKYRDKARDTLRHNVIQRYLKIDLEEQLQFSRDTLPYLKTLLSLVQEFHERYGELKAQNQVIDFDDIEHYCYEILMDQEVADYYRNTISQIFIDEYQDTNLMQEAIINRIKRDNNLFMVGDIKQSIYRFRLAEPSIFYDKYMDYRSGRNGENQAIDLNRNHRSKRGIINYINQIFETLMEGYDDRARLYCGVDCDPEYEYEPELKVVLPVTEEILEEDEDPEVMVIDGEEVDLLTADEELTAAEREAYYISKLIKENLGQPIFDNKMDPPTLRPIEYRDIVILCRSVSTVASIYQDIFKKEGIPSQIQGDDGYFDAVEIETFVDLLTVIDNTSRDIPFIGVLHSEVFGYSAEDLARIRLGHKEGSFVQAFRAVAREDTEMGQRAHQVLETLARWRKRSRTMTLPRFLWELLMDSGCYAIMGALPNGIRRQANLRALCDMAERFCKGKQGTLYDFLFYVDSIKKGNIRMPEARDNSQGQNLVRIMTIHKSKGLEFPMVIVSGLGKNIPRGGKSAFAMHKDIGVGLPLVDRKNLWSRKTLMQNIISIKGDEEDVAEEIRVLYVALTRAKDKLFLVAHDNEERFVEEAAAGVLGNRSFLSMVAPRVPYEINRLRLADIIEEEGAEEIRAAHILDDMEEVPEDTKEQILKQLNYVYPYEAARKLKSKYSVSELNRKDAPIPTGGKSPKASAEGFTAAERGNIYHHIMEKVSFGDCYNKTPEEIMAAVELCCTAMIEDNLLTRQELEAVDLDKIAGFFGTDIGQRAAKADTSGLLQKERPFTLKMKKDGEDILVQGIIDCYFTEDDATILIDYKSNWVDPRLPLEEEKNRLRNEYATQILIYREALNKARRYPVKESYLYLFGPGALVEF